MQLQLKEIVQRFNLKMTGFKFCLIVKKIKVTLYRIQIDTIEQEVRTNYAQPKLTAVHFDGNYPYTLLMKVINRILIYKLPFSA